MPHFFDPHFSSGLREIPRRIVRHALILGQLVFRPEHVLPVEAVLQNETPEDEIVPLTLQVPCPDCGSQMRIVEIFHRG